MVGWVPWKGVADTRDVGYFVKRNNGPGESTLLSVIRGSNVWSRNLHSGLQTGVQAPSWPLTRQIGLWAVQRS